MSASHRAGILAALTAAAIALSGCFSPTDVLEGVIEQAARDEGSEIDIDFSDGFSFEGEGVSIDLNNSGESCLPDIVNTPDGDTMFSQRITGDGQSETCVSAWMVNGPIELPQSLPVVNDQLDPGMIEALIVALAGYADIDSGTAIEQFRNATEGADLDGTGIGVYGDDSRVLVVVVSSDSPGSERTVAIGMMCEGTCS